MAPNAESPFTTNSRIPMYSEVAAAPKRQTVVQKRQKKSVSWAPPDSMVATKEWCVLRMDAGSSWYKQHDFKAFRANSRILCQLAIQQKQGSNNNNNIKNRHHHRQSVSDHSGPTKNLEYCTRGLEIMMNGKKRILRKKVATMVVMEEQQEQKEQQIYSPDFIAELYNEITSSAQNDAQRLGLQDEQEAASIHDEDKKMGKSATTETNMPIESGGDTLFQRISHGRIFRRTPRKTFAPACA